MKSIVIYFVMLLVPVYSYAFYDGVVTHPQHYIRTPDYMFTLIQNLNVNSIRIDYPWNQVEKAPKVYTIPNENIEAIVLNSLHNNITPVLILGYGNPIYNIGRPKNDDEIEKFASYAAWVSNHFKNKKIIFEVWNEWPYSKDMHETASADSAKNYTKLVLKVSKAIKKENEEAIVIAGSANIINYNWMTLLIKNNILDAVDGIAIHPYSIWDNGFLTYKRNVQNIINFEHYFSLTYNNGKPIPIYITEIGLPLTGKSKYTEHDRAAFILGYYDLLKNLDYIKGVWWYNLISDNTGDSKEDSYGLYTDSFELKESGSTFKKITSH